MKTGKDTQVHSKRLQIAEIFGGPIGEEVTIAGWIVSKSSVGGVVFATIRDGSGYIQVAAKRGICREDVLDRLNSVSQESAVTVTGKVRVDPRAPDGKELSITDFEVLASSEKWPITKSAVRSPGFLYDMRHLSIRGKKSLAALKIRSEVVYATFDFFVKRGFTLISAPTLVQSACEGGATLFSLDYFGQTAYLSQSAQLYEEAAINAFEKVFIYQPAFRAEKSKTSKHLTEFWMIEAEQAFAPQEDNMKLQEDLVNHIAERIVEKRAKEFEILGRKFTVPPRPYHRISYDDVLKMAKEKEMGFKWGEDVPTEVERMVSASYDRPVFVTDYPLSARSFYHMTKPDNPKVTLSSDLFATEGYGEIATGGQRIHNYEILLERVENQEIPKESFQWYLDLRKYGLPQHSGFGLGVERTARWIAGAKHIRQVCLFPRTITRINP